MNEPNPVTTTSPEPLVPPPVAPESDKPINAPPLHAGASDDQLPTTRVQSLAPPSLPSPSLPPPSLPPPLPPQGPAHKTQPLRALSRDAATAQLARATRWRMLFTRVKLAASAVPARLSVLRPEAWSQRRVGLSCGVFGLAMIVAALVLGWQSVAIDRLAGESRAGLAVAVVLARSAIAIAAMFVGYALLRVGERLSFPARGPLRLDRDAED